MRSYAVEHNLGSFVGNGCTVVHFTHQEVHDAYVEKTGRHCGSSIRCLNGGRSCACIWMYNNVPNHWPFLFSLGIYFWVWPVLVCNAVPLKSYVQNIRPKPYAQNHMPKTICLKPYTQSHMPKAIPAYTQKPYAQSQTIRLKLNHRPKAIHQNYPPKATPYTQNHTPKPILSKPYVKEIHLKL